MSLSITFCKSSLGRNVVDRVKLLHVLLQHTVHVGKYMKYISYPLMCLFSIHG